MHYYQFNIADYRKDTSHLTPIEHYIYRTLIDWYYLDEKVIPKETQVVLRRLGLGLENEPSLLNVLSDFFKLTDFGYSHSRIDDEIVKYQNQSVKNKLNGMKGGRPPKVDNPTVKTQSVIFANPTETEINPNQELITINHKPNTTNAEFDKFWFEYPKKVGKDAALKAWKKANPDIFQVLDALQWQRESSQWRSGYIPNPATYLNQGRFKDEKDIEVIF